jgi:hypothetical protein
MAIKLRTEIGSRLRNSRVPHRLFGSLLRGSSREVGRWLPAPALSSLLFAPTSRELQTPSSRFVFGNWRFPADLRLWDLVNLDMLSAVRRQNLANKSKIESEIYLYQSVGSQISSHRRTIVALLRVDNMQAVSKYSILCHRLWAMSRQPKPPRKAEGLSSVQNACYFTLRNVIVHHVSHPQGHLVVASSTPSRGRKRFHFRWAPKGSDQRILLHSSPARFSATLPDLSTCAMWPTAVHGPGAVAGHVLTERLTLYHFSTGPLLPLPRHPGLGPACVWIILFYQRGNLS